MYKRNKEKKVNCRAKIKKKERSDFMKQIKEENGITLIALVVTIVVLLILAGISINAIIGDNGIVGKAKEAQNKMENAIESDKNALNSLSNWMDEMLKDPPLLITDSSLTSDDRTSSTSKTIKAKDTKGNQVVVPGGFKIAEASGTSVQQGIVIEDSAGNQFVWVPVSNIDGSNTNPIKLDDGTEKVITLGRYTFNTSSQGTPTIVQKGSEYAQPVSLTFSTTEGESYTYQELSTYRESNEKRDTTGTNTTAKNLQEFIEKTRDNKGYYIARYEASYGSGYNASGTNTSEKYANAKPLSKPSTANSTSRMNYVAGTLWNYVTQPQAAKVCQNMYSGNSYVESDLINSYAWDTAIVYIQAMGNSNYANQDSGSNTSLMNTGSTGDQKCKIFDMAGNLADWTTEYCTGVTDVSTIPGTCRGGGYIRQLMFTAHREGANVVSTSGYISFRPILYVK